MYTSIKPIICGVKGLSLSNNEKGFYSKINPLGFALFKKNLLDKKQTSKLCCELREVTGRKDTPIFIDQEGGKVFRLTQPIWTEFPSPLELGKFAYIGKDDITDQTIRLVKLNAMLIAREMMEIGINVNCAPVCDLLIKEAHYITGSRSFGPDPNVTSCLVNAMVDGLIAEGVQPVIKHMLGQGRATSDSHVKLPIIEEPLHILESSDFSVFKNVKNAKWAMTAHIRYKFLDSINSVSYSSQSIKYIRNNIGFKGIIISDCLTMKSLSESYENKAAKAISAGHDIVFFGGADTVILENIVNNVPHLSRKDFEKIRSTFKPENEKNKKNYSCILLEYRDLLDSLEDRFKNLSKENFDKNLNLIINVLKEENETFTKNLSPLYSA